MAIEREGAVAPAADAASKKNNVMGRPALACERCKRRKIKCDAIRPTCGKCIKMKTQCVYSEAAEHQMANPAKKRKRNKRSTQSSTAPDEERLGSQSTRGSFASRSMSSDLDHHVNDNDLDAAFLLTNLAQPGPSPAMQLPPPSGPGPMRDPLSPPYAASSYTGSTYAASPSSSSHVAASRAPVPSDRLLPQPFSRHVQFGPLSGSHQDRHAGDSRSPFPMSRASPGGGGAARSPPSLKRSRSRSPSPVRTMSARGRGGGDDDDAYAPGDKLRPLMPWPVASQSEYVVPKRLSDAAPSMCATSSSASRDDDHAVTPHGVHSHWLTVLDGPAARSPSPRETAIVSPSSPGPGPWSPGSGARPAEEASTDEPHDPPQRDDRFDSDTRPTSYTVSVSHDRIDLGKLGSGDHVAEAGAVPIKQISQGPHQSWDKMVLYCM